MTGITTIRALGAARIAVGGLWLAGLATGRDVAGASLPPIGRLAAIALAGRDIAQGALLVSDPRCRSAQAGAVIDLLHAASMLPVVAFVPRYRRPAALSAGVAIAWAAAGASASLGMPSVPRGRPRP
jgi:hypothetical protein